MVRLEGIAQVLLCSKSLMLIHLAKKNKEKPLVKCIVCCVLCSDMGCLIESLLVLSAHHDRFGLAESFQFYLNRLLNLNDSVCEFQANFNSKLAK